MSFGTRVKKYQEENKSNNGGGFDLESLKKMQEYKVEACGLETPDTLPGVIVGIVDLGKQPQPDGESLLVPGEDKEAIKEKFPATYFKVVDGKEYKCYPRKAELAVAFLVDFPDINLNLGQFFDGGKEEERPLRMVLSSEFFMSGPKLNVVARPTALKDAKQEDLGDAYSSHPRSNLYKMALGAKLVKAGEPFPTERVGEFLGKAFQFQVCVKFKEGKNNKKYFTQTCSYQGPLARGQSAPVLDESSFFTVIFGQDNPRNVLEELGASIKNTMMLAEDYAEPDNLIKAQLEEIESWRADKYKEVKKYLAKVNGEELEEEDDSPGLDLGDDLDILEDGDEGDGIELEDSSPEDTPSSDDEDGDDSPFDK